MRGVSPIISFVILIVLVFSIATFVVPWAMELTRSIAEQTQNQSQTGIECASAAYAFDTSYGVHGIIWDFGVNDSLEAKIVNKGTLNLWGFSFEIEIVNGTDIGIKHFYATDGSDFTESKPLKPGNSGIIKANITEELQGTLSSIKILNQRCPNVWISQRL